ncbi:unnamed protein product [Arctia plantaginis]|uniref:Zinc finger BED domain-containing protein 4 n=1 Tax=Arctia plantaginis TaxID=874455 RepID=A0A8S1ABM0_ARCPL|nr:unnamed protein product [Arctia plantaginis]
MHLNSVTNEEGQAPVTAFEMAIQAKKSRGPVLHLPPKDIRTDNVDKINLAVSDNAAYIKKAISQELGRKHFGYVAHTINLIVQEAIEKYVPIKSVIERVKLIVAYFKRSTKAAQKVDEFQKQNGATQPKRLLQEVPTRWNSTYYMLERIIEIQDAVKLSIAILGVTSLPNITPEDWLLCNETCKALKCFEEASNYLSGKKHLTASQLLIIIKGIKRVLGDILTSDSSGYRYLPITYDFVRALLDLSHSRFKNIENSNTIGVATFLDHRFKLQPFTSAKQATLRESMIKLVAQEINREGLCENIEVSTKSSLDPTSIFYGWDAKEAVPQSIELACSMRDNSGNCPLRRSAPDVKGSLQTNSQDQIKGIRNCLHSSCPV